ncbi:Biosynthetic peptidoglycan transglycosylase [Streptomyces tendae]
MSDEPQPQQPGWAPRDPQAAGKGQTGEPGTPGAAGTPGASAKAKKPRRPKRTGWRRLIPTWRIALSTVVVGLLLIVGGFFLGYHLVQIPAANALATKQSNVYLYADGSVLARDGEVNRESVGLARISKDAQHAVLAAEDRDFYTESAIDPGAMVRAGWNTATGKGKQSGSTITQQYVKNYYLGQEQTVTRKVKEFFISIKFDREKSKSEILEGYLNTSFFGRGAYGIQAAAQAYFGVDAKDLTAAQGAYLASLLNAPSQYDVVAHPENRPAAEARWDYVMNGMVDKGWLTPADRAAAKFPKPKQSTISTGMSGQRGYVVNIVKKYLIENDIVDEEELGRGGYRITTTLQKDKQDAFVKAVDDKLMSQLDKKERKVDTYVRAGGASVDPKTGKVVAMYNGIDYVSSTHPTPSAATSKSAPPSSPSCSPPPSRTTPRRRAARRSTPTPATTAPANAPSRAGAAAATPPRTRTTATTATSPSARPPTSPSTPCTPRWPSTSAPTRSSRPRST